MAMIQINRNPSRRELRQFAGIWFPAFFAVIGGWLWYGTGSLTWPAALLLPALCVGLVGVAFPNVMRPVYLAWMFAAFPVGWTISHLVLGATYYLLMTPMGLALRLCGYDPMHRRMDRSATTYWIARSEDDDSSRYFRQF